jgi:dihydrofolate reductase
MRRLTAIVAVNEDGAIGRDNALPWRLRSDLRFFRRQTEGHAVIMGANTWRSLGKPLPKRTNIVVAHRADLFEEQPECRIAPGIEAALALAEAAGADDEAFVIGGAAIYEQAAPYVDRYLVTEVRKPVPDADRFLSPALFGDLADWRIARIESGTANDEGDEADFTIFEFLSRRPEAIAQRRAALL